MKITKARVGAGSRYLEFATDRLVTLSAVSLTLLGSCAHQSTPTSIDYLTEAELRANASAWVDDGVYGGIRMLAEVPAGFTRAPEQKSEHITTYEKRNHNNFDTAVVMTTPDGIGRNTVSKIMLIKFFQAEPSAKAFFNLAYSALKERFRKFPTLSTDGLAAWTFKTKKQWTVDFAEERAQVSRTYGEARSESLLLASRSSISEILYSAGVHLYFHEQMETYVVAVIYEAKGFGEAEAKEKTKLQDELNL